MLLKVRKTQIQLANEEKDELFSQGLIPEYKKCTQCGNNKHYSEFGLKKYHINKSSKIILRYECKECNSKYRKEKLNTKTPEELEILKLRNKKWREENRDVMFSNVISKKYSLSPQEYNILLKNQNFCCAICSKHFSESYNGLCVDHDHITGKVRGLLCSSCNRGLGYFKDNEIFLIKASEYIKQSKIDE